MSRKVRSSLYSLARLIGDFNAIVSGRPSRLVARGINKKVGKTVGPKLYLKGRRRKS